MHGLTVVKLGGSHALAAALTDWLEALEAGAGKTVLVCGGGPFADAVRAAQPRMGFDDRAADAMALLAMEQFAIAIAGLRRGFTVVDSRSGIEMALHDASVPVWAPRRMVREAQDIPASWDVTSDSLAAWLAGVLGARRLLLVKRVDNADGRITTTELAQSGLVDKAFPDFLAASGVPGFLLGPSDQTALAQALRADTAIGRPIGLGGGIGAQRDSPFSDSRY
jgi:aspartokinase-like uncharacterized kinase